jgi:hypothetical protein
MRVASENAWSRSKCHVWPGAEYEYTEIKAAVDCTRRVVDGIAAKADCSQGESSQNPSFLKWRAACSQMVDIGNEIHRRESLVVALPRIAKGNN